MRAAVVVSDYVNEPVHRAAATRIPAIVVSGSTHGLGVIRGLGRQGVPVTVVSYDNRDIASSSKFVREVTRAPHPDKDEAQFVKVLLEAAHRRPGSLLIPASDAALGTIARHKTNLEDAGLIVASDGAEVTETLLNKATTFALARSAGVPGPATFAVSDEDDVRRFCASAEFPAVLKPELSHLYRELVGVSGPGSRTRRRPFAPTRSHDRTRWRWCSRSSSPATSSAEPCTTPTSGTASRSSSSRPGRSGTRRPTRGRRRSW